MNSSKTFEALNFFYDHADERIRDKPFMGNPYAIVAVYLCNLVFVVKILPKFMENRSPVNFKKCMLYLDIILCMRSIFFLYWAVYGYLFKYNWSCQPINRSGSYESIGEMELCYWFLITKFWYALQMIVFSAAKKAGPIAFYVHIHHTIFPWMIWIGVNYYPGGHVAFVGLMNSLVHTIMNGNRIISTLLDNKKYKRFAKIVDVYMHVSSLIFSYSEVT